MFPACSINVIMSFVLLLACVMILFQIPKIQILVTPVMNVNFFLTCFLDFFRLCNKKHVQPTTTHMKRKLYGNISALHEAQHKIYLTFMVNSMINKIGCECFLCMNSIRTKTCYETIICSPRTCRKKLTF